MPVDSDPIGHIFGSASDADALGASMRHRKVINSDLLGLALTRFLTSCIYAVPTCDPTPGAMPVIRRTTYAVKDAIC
jgi:hypothetical protein